MDPLDRLFSPFTQDLAPGLPDRSRVAGERILYRAAKDQAAARRPSGFRGGRMEVDLDQPSEEDALMAVSGQAEEDAMSLDGGRPIGSMEMGL